MHSMPIQVWSQRQRNDSDCDDYAGTFEEICASSSFGMLWKAERTGKEKGALTSPVTSAPALSVLPWRINDGPILDLCQSLVATALPSAFKSATKFIAMFAIGPLGVDR